MVTLQVDLQHLLDAIDKLPEDEKRIVREHLNEPLSDVAQLEVSPFKRLAQLAIEKPIEFDPVFNSVNPDDLVESEFGEYLLKALQGKHGAQENSD